MSEELVRRSKRHRLRLGIPTLVKTRRLPSRNYEISNLDLESFVQFLESDEVISKFLQNDTCYMMSDSYLLASVFTYFQWSGMGRQWNRRDFFAFLYLIIEIEEEHPPLRWELLPYALGDAWNSKMKSFIRRKNSLFQKMMFRALVSRRTCDQVMRLMPDHPLWRRSRPSDHGGTNKPALDTQKYFPSGPNEDPLPCIICGRVAEPFADKTQKLVAKALPGLDVSTDKSPANKRKQMENEGEEEQFFDFEQIKRLRLRGIDRRSFMGILVDN